MLGARQAAWAGWGWASGCPQEPLSAWEARHVPSLSQPMPALAAPWSSWWLLQAGCRLGLRHLEPHSVGRTLSAHRQGEKPPPGQWLLAGAWRRAAALGALTTETLPSCIHLTFGGPGRSRPRAWHCPKAHLGPPALAPARPGPETGRLVRSHHSHLVNWHSSQLRLLVSPGLSCLQTPLNAR